MNTIETHVLELIGENIDSPDVFTDDSTGMAKIRDSINSAIEDICMVTGSYERRFLIPMQSGMMFYRITSDRDIFAWPKSVWLVNQKRRLEQKDLVWLLNYNPRFLYESATPQYYYLIGNDILGVHPAPPSTTDMLQIDAVAIPDRYTTDTDRIKLADNFQWGCAHYAVSEYWASRGDAITATDHFMRFLKHIDGQRLYPQTAERQWQQRSEKVK
jgi:hypothetical protein